MRPHRGQRLVGAPARARLFRRVRPAAGARAARRCPHVVVRRPQRAEYPDYLRAHRYAHRRLAGQRHPPLHHPSYAAMGRSRLLHPVGLPPVLPAEPPARHGVRLGQHPRRHFYDAGPFRRAGRACHRRGYHERHLRRGQMLTRIIQRGARLCAHEYQYIREYAPYVDNLGAPLRPDLRGLSGAVPLRPGAARGTGRRRTAGPFFHSQRLDAPCPPPVSSS